MSRMPFFFSHASLTMERAPADVVADASAGVLEGAVELCVMVRALSGCSCAAIVSSRELGFDLARFAVSSMPPSRSSFLMLCVNDVVL